MEYNEVGQGNAVSGNAETTNATTVKQEVNSDNGGNTTRPQHNNPVQASIRSPYQVYTNPNPDNSTSLNLDNINIKKGQVILQGGGEFEEGQSYLIRDNKGKATTRVWKNGDFVPFENSNIGRQGTPKSTNQASSVTGETLDLDNFNKKNVILGGGEFEERQAYVIRDNKGKATTRMWKKGDFVPYRAQDKRE